MILVIAMFLIILGIVLLTILPGWLRQRRLSGAGGKYFSRYNPEDDPAVTGAKISVPPDPAHRLDRPF